MRNQALLLGATALWLPGASLLAQGNADFATDGDAASVAVGSRVRISAPELGPQPFVGQVIALEPGAVVVGGKDGGDKWRVSLATAKSFEVSTGRTSETARGAMVGGAIGAMSGILTNIGDYNTDHNTLAISAVGAASGAAVGALVGWAIKSDTWRRARVPAVTAAILPVRHGASFSVRVAWGPAVP